MCGITNNLMAFLRLETISGKIPQSSSIHNDTEHFSKTALNWSVQCVLFSVADQGKVRNRVKGREKGRKRE